MTKTDFLLLVDELLEQEPGTLKGPEDLEACGWDSLSVISFIAMVDEHFGFTAEPRALVKCKIVDDLIALVAARLEGGTAQGA